MNPKSGSLIRVAVLAAITSVFSTQLSASGFAITENSASAQGNSYAGAAAAAEDASTVWFNPAGMMKLDSNQIVVAGHFISPSSSFTNQGSTNADGSDLLGDNDDAGIDAFVPNFYWVTAINDEMKFGLGINAPFGLKTEYNDTWVGRYHAVTSDLKTVNFNPSLAFQLNEKLSVGVGLNVMLVDVTLTSAIDFGALLNSPGAADGFGDLEGDNLNGVDGLAYGLNMGVMYDITPKTTLGLAYRTEMDVDVEGTAKFKVPSAAAPVLSPGAFQPSGALEASITLPQSFSVSIAHDYEVLTVLADITWTGWSSFDELRIEYENPDQPDSVTTEDWDDTFRYSIGLDWRQSEKLTLRTGIAYDETAIPSPERRTARIPGNDRTWLSFGGTYVINPAFTVDVGYTHLFISDTKINNTFESSQPALAATLTGTYEASVDILSAQLRWNY
jgi:long-chain fatty acid transport protein